MVDTPVLGLSVTVKDPFLLRRYAAYIAANKRAGAKLETKLQSKLEEQLAVLNVSVNTASGQAEIRNPDFVLENSEFQDALSNIFDEKIKEIEAKLKKTSILKTKPGGGGREGTKIGKFEAGRRLGSTFTESITSTLKLSAQQIQLQNNIDDTSEIDLLKNKEIVKALNKNQGKKLFEVVKSDNNLFNRFFRKATTLQLINKIEDKLALTTIKFKRNQFKVPPFRFKITPTGTIFIALDTQFEKQLLSLITKAHVTVPSSDLKQYEKDVIAISKGQAKVNNTLLNGVPFRLITTIPTGGSIPIALARISGVRQETLRRRAAQRARRKKEGIGIKQITAAQFSAVLRSKIAKLGPFGPIGGRPPPGSTRLTHRTGEYLSSIHVISVNQRNNLIAYWYSPKYFVHETLLGGQRDPRDTIESTIRQVAFELFGENFEPVKGN